MGKIEGMENEEIATQLLKFTATRISKVFEKVHEENEELVSDFMRELAKRVSAVAKPSIRQVGLKYEWRYADCKEDTQGFCKFREFRPFPYDMTLAKIRRVGETSLITRPAWWTGNSWEGRRLKDGDEVVKWKLEAWGQ